MSTPHKPSEILIRVSPRPGSWKDQAHLQVKVMKVEHGKETETLKTFDALGGRPGHRTPHGNHHIGEKTKDAQSSIYGDCVNPKTNARRHVGKGSSSCKAPEKYEGAKMPFYTRFTAQAGFHVGSMTTQSHGCIHMEENAAQWIFDNVPKGTNVIIEPTEPKDRPEIYKHSPKHYENNQHERHRHTQTSSRQW